MSDKEYLKSMLNNVINDKPEEASLDLHNYLTGKMREVSGLAQPAQHAEDLDDTDVKESEQIA